MRLIYIFDAYCVWSYVFSPIFRDILNKYHQSIDIEIISGGMILTDKPVHISILAPAYNELSEQVNNAFNKKMLGEDFLWHIQHSNDSDWFPNSSAPAKALIAFKELAFDRIGDIIVDVQYGLFNEGRDLTDDQAYLHILEKYNIDPDEFFEIMHSEKTNEIMEHEFNLTKRLQITAFPTILLQINIDKFYIVSQGYDSFENITQRISDLLAEINN